MKRVSLLLALTWLVGCSGSAPKPAATPETASAAQHIVSPRPTYLEAPPGQEEMDWAAPVKPEKEEAKPRKAAAQPYFVSQGKQRSLFVLPTKREN